MSNRVDTASTTQTQASNPATSAWVSANAGSGKTHVLVNRVVRLLLDGALPERVLCLTYTRAAAAEMSRRLYDELAGWIGLQDTALVERIHQHTGHVTFNAGDLAAARQLFAKALETPGGLKVQTIHAFCERLLQRFPVEAGMVPGFDVIDEQTAREVLGKARAEVFTEACADETSRTAQDLATIVAHTSADRFDELLSELLDNRHVLAPLLGSFRARDAGLDELRQLLGLRPGDDTEKLAAEALPEIDVSAYQRAASQSCVVKSTRERIERLLLAHSASEKFARLQEIFLTASGSERTESGLFTKKAAQDFPNIHQHLITEQKRVARVIERWRAARVLAASGALLRVGAQIITAYGIKKRQLGLSDYDDLILHTRALLEDQHASLWVLFKLDGGLDHVLIDEAQDTSPQQWSIIAKLTEEFFAGEGARTDTERTVFAVGDYKQSIFSFQGADPAAFSKMQSYFRSKIANAGGELTEVPLQVSFRSTPQVLEIVDAVFSQPLANNGLQEIQAGKHNHTARRTGQAGRVELWPLTIRDDSEDGSPWTAPRRIDAGRHPRVKLAQQIAATIRSWIDEGRELTPRGRTVRYSDILILVRRRTTFMDAMVRALKLAGIPVAGADRLELTKHIAVQDLMALARFVLLPEDDLTLASVLKGPLVARDDGTAFDDDDLLPLAYDRGRQTLWQRLCAAVDDGAPYSEALGALRTWRARAGFVTPYQFFAHVLIADGRRKAMLRRLGTEAADPIDAFLSEALNFQTGKTPTLHEFLGWLEGANLQIKRDMDHSVNEVRVMTVHGAKGLEANIVILPDTTDVPDRRKTPDVLLIEDHKNCILPVWRLRSQDRIHLTEQLKARHGARAIEEYNRLLYVAMTRACDWLLVCGYSNKAEAKAESWYGLISSVLQRPEYRVDANQGTGTVWRIEGKQLSKPSDHEEETDELAEPVRPPRWAIEKPSAEAASLRWIVPSKLAPEGGTVPEESPERFEPPLRSAAPDRYQRGNLIHKLLQVLPEVAPDERRTAGRRFLSSQGVGLDQDQVADILSEVMALLDDQAFAPVFAPGSHAEVPLAAQLDLDGSSVGLTGQIDRLVVSDDTVLIVDYKTNRPAPASIEQADAGYIRQLAAYRAAVGQVYPDRPVRAALLWTNTATLMEVPADMLDAVLRSNQMTV